MHQEQRTGGSQEKWGVGGHLHSSYLSRGPEGYCARKPSRQNSRMGRMQSQTIHQTTTLHSAEVSTARGHLERGQGGEKRCSNWAAKINKVINQSINTATRELQTPVIQKGGKPGRGSATSCWGAGTAAFSINPM